MGLRVKAGVGDKVIDYCAGSGGKSLTYAHQMKGTGRIYLHDVRKSMQAQAKKRMSRAGITNVEYCFDDDKKQKLLPKLHRQCDWVVLDVPCSGVGTMRRNPDLKLKFNLDRFQYYLDLQQAILNEGVKFLKKDGKLVYITCSFLEQENL